ncbi:(-)-germacrene d synthase [Quercus suber]|uniref:(-)-germacrene d synthase n=1 Tax=Quercus suber TaxID=58331 RepID=A0AAW0JBZ4_QUESU
MYWLVKQIASHKFKDNKGNFKESLIHDVQGMLHLYEATHMRVCGEDILDEALKFTTTYLKSVVTNLNPTLVTQVNRALKQPIRKWWKDLDFANKLSFARDRVVKCYFWILGVYFEPQYSIARKILTKIICMASTIDDIYDAYGTYEELELFTDAIKRWDINCVDQIPEYMKLCYKALLDVYEEIEDEMSRKEDHTLFTLQQMREIDEILQQIYKDHHNEVGQEDNGSLYTIALRFRLLRQQGYNIPSDSFNKFKDNKGNFKESLIHDVQGMLHLYEATHMRVCGEDILDEALKFTTTYLKSVVTNLNPTLVTQVNRALKQPIRKWWKDLDFANKLSFARDRVVKCYFWILGVYFEPQYSIARKILTKIICMASTIDDIYDAYGTYEELELFTDAIKRWDINCVDQIPEYMKLCYKALLDVYEEIEDEMSKEGRSYLVYFATNAFEQKREHFVSSIDCYMKQHGVSKEEVHNEFQKQIENAWKDINQGCLRPIQVPMPLLTRILNFSQVMDLLYKDEDAYTHNGEVLILGVTSLLVGSVPI